MTKKPKMNNEIGDLSIDPRLKDIRNIHSLLVRQLFSVAQYKQFYNDIVSGYIEFLKSYATKDQIRIACEVKDLKISKVTRLKVNKPCRIYLEPFRALDLIGILSVISNQQFAVLAELILKYYCDAISKEIPLELVNAVKTIYLDFLIGDMPKEESQESLKEEKRIGRPPKGVTV